MATHSRIRFRALKTLSGMACARQEFPEAASQTFKEGAVVCLQAGYLQECAANPPLILGLATKNGQNGASAGTKAQTVMLAHPDTLFLGNLDDMTSEGTGTGLATDRGKMYGITKTVTAANTPWTIDKNKAAGATRRVVIWDLWDGLISTNTGSAASPAWTDTIPQVVFSFDPQFFQGHRTS